MQKNFKPKKDRKMYQIFGILLLCFALISIFSYTTVAWLMDQSITSNGEPNITLVGTLDLDVTTNFKFKNLALAPDTTYTTDQSGEDIATYLKTSALHDIDGAYVRIKFSTTRKNVGESSYIDNSDLLMLYFVDNLTTNTTYSETNKDKWFYNSSDNYYYYLGGIYSTNIMFNRGYKTSNTMQNIQADADVRIEFIVEAIQRQYGASAEVWDTAPQVFKDMVTTESTHVTLPEKISASVSVSGASSNYELKTGIPLSVSLSQAGVTQTINDSNSCGWFKDADCTIPIDPSTIVTKDMTLYTKTATLDKLNITTNSSGKKVVTKINSSITGEVVIPNDVQIIGNSAFSSAKISSIVIPTSVTTIEYLAIHASKITKLFIPKSVTSIASYVGSPATLVEIKVDDANPVYTDGGGYNCIIDKNTKTLMLGCKTTVIPPDSSLVQNIDRRSFTYNKAISKLTIPANITNIELAFLQGCSNMKTITVDNANTVYHSQNNCVIKTATKELVWACTGATIPDDGSVTSILEYSLTNGSTTLNINKYITSIPYNAIEGMLTKIICDSENSVFKEDSGCLIEKSTNTLRFMTQDATIPNYVSIIDKCGISFFADKNIVIPTSVNLINKDVIYYTNQSGNYQINIYLPSSVTTISENAIRNSNINIYTDVASSGSKPSGWNSGMVSTTSTVTWHYGYTLDQFKTQFGISDS